MRIAVLLCALALVPFLPGCAASEKNLSAREWQRAECNRVIDQEARKKCLERLE